MINDHGIRLSLLYLCRHGGGVLSRPMEHLPQPAPVLLVAVDVEVHRGVDDGQQM